MSLHFQSVIRRKGSDSDMYMSEVEGFVFNQYSADSHVKVYKLVSRPTSRNRKWQAFTFKKENLEFFTDYCKEGLMATMARVADKMGVTY